MPNEKFTLDQWAEIGNIVHNLSSLRAALLQKLSVNNRTHEWIAEYSKLDISLGNFRSKLYEIVSDENYGNKELPKTLSSFFRDKE